MAIELTCMNCWSQVTAEDRDRGRTIPCPVCEGELRVPGDPPPDAPGAAAEPTPESPPAPAPAAPVARAAPVLARPVMAAPVAKAAPKKDDDEPEIDFSGGGGGAKRPVRHDEDDEDDFEEDEEDDDDTPRRPAKKGNGKKILLLALAAVGGLFLLCAGVVGYFVWSVKQAADEVAANMQKMDAEIAAEMEQARAEAEAGQKKMMQQNGASQGKNAKTTPPGKTAPPGKPVPQSEWSKPWAPTSSDLGAAFHRFVAQMPPGAKQSGDGDLFGQKGKAFLTVRYTATEAGVEYRAESTTVDSASNITAEQFAIGKLPPGAAAQPGSRPVTVGGRPGLQFEVKHPGNVVETIQAAQVASGRADKSVWTFAFAVKHNPDEVRRYEGLDVEAKKRQFFSGVRILVDPNELEPPKSSPKSKPKDPMATVPPKSPPKTPPTPPLPTTTDELKFVTKIDPFAAAVVLPGAKEVLTFGAGGRGAPPGQPPRGGVVQRFSAESFKQLGKFTLPDATVHAAAADEKGGKLYLLVTRAAAKPGAAPSGEVRAYNLKDFAAGTDAPMPAATMRLGGAPAALDVAPDGKAVYAAAVTVPPNPRLRAGRSKVFKIDPQALSPAGDIDVPSVATAVRASPDGKVVFVGDAPPSLPPAAGAAPAPPGNVHVIDAAAWKRLYGVAVAHGGVTDIEFVTDAKAVVGAAPVGPAAGNAVKLYVVDAAGEATDLPTALRFQSAGQLAVTPDRQRLVVASGVSPGQTGTEVFAVGPQGGSLRSAAALPLTAGGLLAGPVVLTADAKYAVYGSGVVLDVSATAEKP